MIRTNKQEGPLPHLRWLDAPQSRRKKDVVIGGKSQTRPKKQKRKVNAAEAEVNGLVIPPTYSREQTG
jgi:hypothetical protein